MYTKTYTATNPEYKLVEGFELPIPMPDKPPLAEMRNFGKPLSEQKFWLEDWPSLESLSSDDADLVAERMWHLRRNGDWWIIKGDPYYIPGCVWMYYNFYHSEHGELPTFRFEGVEFGWVWEMVVRSKTCFGLLDMKPRRAGDTDKGLAFCTDLVTRYKNARFGNQHIVEKDALGNYNRAASSLLKFPWFFQPITNAYKGSVPGEDLLFSPLKGSPEEDFAAALNGSITYRPSVLKAYDGWRLTAYLGDEWLKQANPRMPILAQWGIIKQTIALEAGLKIIGKAIIPSTVEDMKGSESVRVARVLWDTSDPRSVDGNGQTISGLWRIFRSFKVLAPVDEFGFHKVDEFERKINETRRSLAQAGEGLIEYNRKFPRNVEDALASTGETSILHADLLEARKRQLTQYAAGENPPYWQVPVRGNMVWINPARLSLGVRFEPSTSGKFIVMQPPVKPNSMTVNSDGSITPGNKMTYSAGLDPVDHVGTTGSMNALAIFRHFNPHMEQGKSYTDDQGAIRYFNTEEMQTNKFVCYYIDRPKDPREAYAEMLKACIFYGCDVLPETNKPGFKNYVENLGYGQYLAYASAKLGVGAKGAKEAGVASTIPVIQAYTDALSSYVYNHYLQLDSMEHIEALKKFTGDNRGECDGMVASGMALLNYKSKIATFGETTVNKGSSSNGGFIKTPFIRGN